jgi:RNA polymerase primary sigma factor
MSIPGRSQKYAHDASWYLNDDSLKHSRPMKIENDDGLRQPDDDRKALRSSTLNEYSELDQEMAPYFKAMRQIPLLKPDDEKRLGKRIKDARDQLIRMALDVQTDFIPLRAFQKKVKEWTRKKKNSRKSIEAVYKDFDHVLSLMEDNNNVSTDLADFVNNCRKCQRALSQAMDEMVSANLRLVIKIARTYGHRGLALTDLIQEGNLGLIKAAARFDYTTGYRFSTFAQWWIRQSITRALHDHSRTIRLPVHVYEIRNRFFRSFYILLHELGREPSIFEIAEHSGLSEEKVISIIQLNREAVSLETPVGDDGDSLSDFIENNDGLSPVQAVELAEIHKLLGRTFASLAERDRIVLSMRFGLGDHEPRTLEEVGRELNISRERVRQLEKRALDRLRDCPDGDRLESSYAND